jgi:hypothetical protein
MSQYHTIDNLHFVDNSLVLTIDGEEKQFGLSEISQPLLNASEIERSQFQVSPSGYGIHWPRIDEDLSIDGLLSIVHTPEHKESA